MDHYCISKWTESNRRYIQIYIYAEKFHEKSSTAHKILELIFSFAARPCNPTHVCYEWVKAESRKKNKIARRILPLKICHVGGISSESAAESTKKRSHK